MYPPTTAARGQASGESSGLPPATCPHYLPHWCLHTSMPAHTYRLKPSPLALTTVPAPSRTLSLVSLATCSAPFPPHPPPCLPTLFPFLPSHQTSSSSYSPAPAWGRKHKARAASGPNLARQQKWWEWQLWSQHQPRRLHQSFPHCCFCYCIAGWGLEAGCGLCSLPQATAGLQLEPKMQWESKLWWRGAGEGSRWQGAATEALTLNPGLELGLQPLPALPHLLLF